MNDSPNPIADPAAAFTPLVIFGRDEAGKAHASRFSAEDAALAEKAAGLMGMRALRLETDEQEDLAAKLPVGRLFESGRAFVPFVKQAIYAELDASPGAFTPAGSTEPAIPLSGPGEVEGGSSPVASATTDSKPNQPMRPAEPPTDWEKIGVGSLVLAAEESETENWFVARVVSHQAEDLFQLRWGGEWINEPPFVRRRDHLALLPPALAGLLVAASHPINERPVR